MKIYPKTLFSQIFNQVFCLFFSISWQKDTQIFRVFTGLFFNNSFMFSFRYQFYFVVIVRFYCIKLMFIKGS